MFRDKLKSDLNKLTPSEQVKAAVLESIEEKPKAKIFNLKFASVIAACLAVVIAVGIVSGIDLPDDVNIGDNNYVPLTSQLTTKPQKTSKKEDKTKPNKSNANLSDSDESNSDYDEIYKRIKKSKGRLIYKVYKGMLGSSSDVGSVVIEDAPGTGSKDFSKTNTQHEDVDEEDVIKTDGDFIYRVNKERKDKIEIYKADGKKSKKLSTIELHQFFEKHSYDFYVKGIYLFDNKLVVIYDTYSKVYARECKCKRCVKNKSDFTQIFIFDVSNKNHPKFLKHFKQSGDYDSSRMIDGKLYIGSDYYFAKAKLRKKETTRYLPILCDGETQRLQSHKNIHIVKNIETTGYSVICSYDISKVSRIDDLSVLGNCEIGYVSSDNIYLLERNYSTLSKTNIVKLSITQGLIDKKESGFFNGKILNQFSLDEYNGYLRLVATQNKYSNKSYNSLVIFDSKMNQISSIEKLAKGERVYSVRFMGDYAYFVTFKETDPLFCANLSNPKNPKIVSELKIPGFSDYLHPFGKDKLFGFGQSATKKGRVTGLKLSMFDISDKENIKEESVLKLGEGFAEANYNHKAILVSNKKNLISFAVRILDKKYYTSTQYCYYYIYRYNEKNGFEQVSKIKIECFEDEARGLYIDDYFYISNGDSLNVVDLNTFKVVKEI